MMNLGPLQINFFVMPIANYLYDLLSNGFFSNLGPTHIDKFY
jgi:hypothetical protein